MSSLLTGLLAFIAATLGLALLMHWWFRRADHKVQRRLAGARQREFVPPAANAAGPGGPGAAPGEGLVGWLGAEIGDSPEAEAPAPPVRGLPGGLFPHDPLGRGEHSEN
jgi:hypothetical protein